MNQAVKRNLKDAVRVFLLMALAALTLYLTTYHLPDPSMGPLLTSSSILLFIAAFSHVSRRIVIPSLNTTKLMEEVMKGNMAAAVTLVGGFYVFVQMVQAGVVLMK